MTDMREALEQIANGYLGDQTAEQQFLWAQQVARTALSAPAIGEEEVKHAICGNISCSTVCAVDERDESPQRPCRVAARAVVALFNSHGNLTTETDRTGF